MSALTIDVIRARIAAICQGAPFRLVPARTPFDFTQQPTGEIDGCFRLTVEGQPPVGAIGFYETRTDLVHIWVARKQAGDPEACYDRLLQDSSALRAAVIHDGVSASGDYHVPDEGPGFQINHEAGQEFAVLHVPLPVNYEAVI